MSSRKREADLFDDDITLLEESDGYSSDEKLDPCMLGPELDEDSSLPSDYDELDLYSDVEPASSQSHIHIDSAVA